MSNFDETQQVIYDFIVDMLVDMSDPPEEEEDDAYEDMRAVTSVLMEGLNFTVIGVEGNIVTVTVDMS